MKTATLPLLLCAVMLLSVSESRGWWLFCPRGWTRLYGRCFKYVPMRLTWTEAENHCLALGGHLASVHSSVENRALRHFIWKHSGRSKVTWIGGSDAFQEHRWRWSDGTLMRYTKWCHGGTNYDRRRNCLRMNYSSRKCWDDHHCKDRHPSVCVRRTWFWHSGRT